MDRQIEVKVFGNHLWKDGNRAGVQGEGNVTTLRISFDEGWGDFAKSITFFDAKGRNPVKRILTADLLEDITNSTLVYLCKIPPEPLAEAGWCSFVIDGYIDDARQRSVETQLEVVPARETNGATEPSDPTPSQAEQLQGEIEAIMDDIQKAAEAARYTKYAEQYAADAKASAEAAEEARWAAEDSETLAANSAAEAKAAKAKAEEARSAAEQSAQNAAASEANAANAAAGTQDKADEAALSAEEAKASAAAAKSSETNASSSASKAKTSETNAASSANTAANAAAQAQDCLEEVETKLANGDFDGEDGYTPVKGKDYWTPTDKSEMVNEVMDAMPTIGDMEASVYDPAGLKKDIFRYVGEMASDTLTRAYAYTDAMVEGSQGSGGAGFLECYLDQTEFWEVNDAYQNGSIVVMWDNNELWPMVYAETDVEYRFQNVSPDGIRTAYLTEDGWSNGYDEFGSGGSAYSMPRIGWAELPASAWESDGSLHSQVVEIEGVSEYSQVDLTPSVEQLAIFYEKDLTFVTENDGGVVTVYAIGQKPTNDYTVQVTITEVSV